MEENWIRDLPKSNQFENPNKSTFFLSHFILIDLDWAVVDEDEESYDTEDESSE